MARARNWTTLGLAAAGAVALAALAWHDVLPGGWTLRGLVKPHAVREAEARAAHRAARLAEFAREAVPPGSVVFLGSSTIERFALAAAFPGVPCANRGVGDEPLAELVARLDASLPAAPAACVVYGGSVDARRLARSPAEVARDAERLLDALAARAPGVPVAWIGVLPDREWAPDVARRVRELNGRLEALVAARGGVFVGTHRAPLVDARGALAEDASVDGLHLSPAGYAALAAWLREALPALASKG